jgi:transcriptional regulator
LYVPSSFQVGDPETLADFIEAHGFATLITTSGGRPNVSHVPLVLDRAAGTLAGHLALANPHHRTFDGVTEALAIFHGPHGYISPAWYRAAPAVPTWNYAVVHVRGRPKLVDAGRTRRIVERTVDQYESSRAEPWSGELPEEYRERMLAGIVGFEMTIESIEGKFKLGQNRSLEDRRGMLAGLRSEGPSAVRLADFIERHAPPDAEP